MTKNATMVLELPEGFYAARPDCTHYPCRAYNPDTGAHDRRVHCTATCASYKKKRNKTPVGGGI